ncbi:MAG: TonB-dependent receptor [Parafilimonas sp.]
MFAANAQKTISGRIINNGDKQPIAGATIVVKNSSKATQTASDGTFSIQVPQDSSALIISVVGYDQLEVSTTGKTSMGDIALSSNTASLNDVVVTGYSSQRKKDITGSVAVVNMANARQVPSGSTESALQGQAAGVTIINSGAPGAGSVIRIRGITSVGSSDPLVIVDGTPGNLHDININDIESIQVLKDAGAASIYGVRGSNGVIIVTTKRGKSGKVQLSYDAFVGTQQPLKKGYDIANPTETGSALWQEYINDGLTPADKQYGNGAAPVVPDYITPPGGKEGDPNTDPSTYALYKNQITKANKAGTDWFHTIFNPATIMSHNISASGGSDKSTYFFSFNYLNQDGTLKNTSLKRYSARINTTFSLLNNRVRVGENAYVFFKNNPGYLNLPGVNSSNPITMSYSVPEIIPVFDIMGNFAGTGSQGLGNQQNPYAVLSRQSNNKNNDWQINGNMFAEVDVLKHLTLRTSIGGRVDNFYRNAFVYTAYENAENSQNPNSYLENYGWNSSLTWTNTLRFSQLIADKHNLTVLIGSEYINNDGRAAGATRGSYYITDSSNLTVDPNLWTLNFGSPAGQTNANITSNNGIQTPYEQTLYSLFGRVDYSFNDKYLFSATVRRDGSSVFASEKRYGTFPAFTAGWRISQEEFMKGVSWISDLKIRGGWGKLGSISNITPTNPYTLFGQAANQSYYDIYGTGTSSAAGLYTSQYGNTNTSWEKDIITNIGFDASLFKSKIDVTVEWYEKKISGLIFLPLAVGTGGGAALPYINAGNIVNKGIDASATYHGTVAKDFHFDITGTFTSYNNKVQSLPPGEKYLNINSGNTTISRLQPGEPAGAFFGYQVIGLFQNQEDVAKSPTQDAAAPGRFKYKDVNGDGQINADDRTFFGNPNPDFTAGLNISIAYKSFDFSTFFYSSFGNDILNNVRASTDFPQAFGNAMSTRVALHSPTLVNDAGQPTNINDPEAHVVNQNGNVPILERSANFSNATAFNSYPLENGSFLKNKSLTLGYTIPNKVLEKYHIDRLRIYVQAINLFTITKYSGLDPEIGGSNTLFGIDGGNYPNNQKVYYVGINVAIH